MLGAVFLLLACQMVGEAVARGQPVGIVAEGGHCDGGCLHLGTRVDGAYVNPMRFLRPRPELEPW